MVDLRKTVKAWGITHKGRLFLVTLLEERHKLAEGWVRIPVTVTYDDGRKANKRRKK